MARMTKNIIVSTRSRPKAAGLNSISHILFGKSFNTQPPEGGWRCILNCCVIIFCFNTQPPEGGWTANNPWQSPMAGFNTQPPEGGWQYGSSGYSVDWSFNTQPPEGGWILK